MLPGWTRTHNLRISSQIQGFYTSDDPIDRPVTDRLVIAKISAKVTE